MNQVWVDRLIDLSVAVFFFVLGYMIPVIRKTFRKRLLRRFWGKDVVGQDFVVCYGKLEDSRLMPPNEPPQLGDKDYYRYGKRYHNGREIRLVGPWGGIVGGCEVRAASYIVNRLGEYRNMPIPVVDDETALQNLNRTFVALGSSSSNEITDLVLRESNNGFLEFGQEGSTAFIRDKKSGRRFEGFKAPIKKDYCVVLKLPSLWSAGKYFFVCAGLGEWGTSGASWYLATKWRELQQEFGDSFGIVVEVELGADDSANKVFPIES
jgi:hypothetical protein